MRSAFGRDYANYEARTKRIVPFVHSFFTSAAVLSPSAVATVPGAGCLSAGTVSMRPIQPASLIMGLMAVFLAGCQTVEMIGASGTAPRSLPVQVASEGPRDGIDLTLPRVYLMRGLARTVSEGVDHLCPPS